MALVNHTNGLGERVNAAVAFVICRLAPVRTMSALGAVHAIMGAEHLSMIKLDGYLVSRRDLFRRDGLGWHWVGPGRPPNPVAQKPHERPRDRARIMDDLRTLGATFTYAEAGQVHVAGNQVTNLLRDGHIEKITRGTYRVTARAPTAQPNHRPLTPKG